MSYSSEFNPEWCRIEDQRCEECPMGKLREIDPGVADHTLQLLGQFDPRDVVKAVNTAETDHDSYELEMMVAVSGSDIQEFYGVDSGFDLAKDAILKINALHRLSTR